MDASATALATSLNFHALDLIADIPKTFRKQNRCPENELSVE